MPTELPLGCSLQMTKAAVRVPFSRNKHPSTTQLETGFGRKLYDADQFIVPKLVSGTDFAPNPFRTCRKGLSDGQRAAEGTSLLIISATQEDLFCSGLPQTLVWKLFWIFYNWFPRKKCVSRIPP